MAVVILDTFERGVCEDILEQRGVKRLFEQHEALWLSQVKATDDYFTALRNARGDLVPWSPREIVGFTAIGISVRETELMEEVEKLNQLSDRAKRIYKKLNDLVVVSNNIRLNIENRVMFLILAVIVEKNSSSEPIS